MALLYGLFCCGEAKHLLFTAYGGIPARQSNIAAFTQLYPEHAFDCIVFVFNEELDTSGLGFAPHCTLVKHRGRVFDFYKIISPDFLVRKNYSGVVFHAGDLAVDAAYNPLHLFRFMAHNDLHVASPVVPGSDLKCMNEVGPVQSTTKGVLYGRLVNYIEIQVTAYDYIGWSCFWSFIEPQLSSIGMFYDFCHYSLCPMRMGILDTVNATHNVGDVHATRRGGTADGKDEWQQFKQWTDSRGAHASFFAPPCTFIQDGNCTLGLLPPSS